MLKVENLEVHYGSIHAIKGVSFEVGAGEIVSLIGSNGSGKTSILHAISGITPKSSGRVLFEGRDVSRESAHRIAGAGLVQVPEGRRIFADMSVYENLEMGGYLKRDKAGFKRKLEAVYERFPRLKERRHQTGGTLSGGEQQMLAMGRALMAEPRLLLLDEPSMGLSPVLVEEIFRIIQAISAQGTTILLVEQNAYKALSIAHRAYVLETGSIVLSGPAREMMEHDEVKKAYLGG